MPRSIWFKALTHLFVALWAPLESSETGWQPIPGSHP